MNFIPKDSVKSLDLLYCGEISQWLQKPSKVNGNLNTALHLWMVSLRINLHNFTLVRNSYLHWICNFTQCWELLRPTVKKRASNLCFLEVL